MTARIAGLLGAAALFAFTAADAGAQMLDKKALSIAEAGQPIARLTLGPDLGRGERPQAVVPAGAWQAAEPLGPWVLVGCTVAPGFEFSGFEMAPAGWSPT